MILTGHGGAWVSRQVISTLMVILGVSSAAPAVAQVPAARRDAPAVPTNSTAPRPAPPALALPALSLDAQRLVDQLRQDQVAIIEQLRFLQASYRDAGHAEDAAAIAAYVRQLQQRTPIISGTVTADLVNEGLQVRDEAVRMSAFRDHVGQTLSFAIRGRDDQTVWGTTTYTEDSALETAAVHVGLLRAGQTGIVKVQVLRGQDRYDAAAQNGVLSASAGRNQGSYRFVSASTVPPRRTEFFSSFRDLVGHSVIVPVVGATSGALWGSDILTDDSSVAAAAVHAGVLSIGEFGFVKVTLMPGQATYIASARNGVSSQPYADFGGSFRVESAPQPWIVELPGGEDASRLVPLSTLRGRTDVSFIVQVTGSVSGPVWGTGPYTDDSSIATAAVHAGVLKPNEIGMVRVTIVTGRQSYLGSDANGIKSQGYGPWEGSFRLERVK